MIPPVDQNMCVQIFGASSQLNVIRQFAQQTRQSKKRGAHTIKKNAFGEALDETLIDLNAS